MSERTRAHIFMVCVVVSWGFDYVPAKWGLEIMPPLSLLFLKYGLGFLVMICIKLFSGNRNLIRIKDLPLFILCSITGEIIYFFCEYSAMDYMPVSLITIILGFVPAVSVIIERVVLKRKSNRVVIIGILFCILGIVLVIGADFHIIFQGRVMGYIFAFSAVLSWNIYNFITASLQQYDSVTLACTQMLCTLCLCAPLAIHGMPDLSVFTPQIVAGVLWMGLCDSGLGFLVLVYGLQKLGPTTSALYSDFMPVTATFFGAVLLHESITWLQVLGGIIVIVAGFFVIREKGRLDEERIALDKSS